MSTLVEHPGTGVAVRPGKKKTGTSLISATLDTVAHPLRIASHCRDELREVLQHVDDVPQPNIVNLPAARFNHARMLSRVAVVREVHLGLFGMFIPPAPTTTRGDAIDMLSALFGATAKAKAESKTLLARALVCSRRARIPSPWRQGFGSRSHGIRSLSRSPSRS